MSPASANGNGVGRAPRWTRRDTLALLQARRAVAAGEAGRRLRGRWEAVAEECRRRGVAREPGQCRKRWGNLSCDRRRIKAWEARRGGAGGEASYWEMGSEKRRERRLPGFFDREVFLIMDDGDEEEKPVLAAVPISERESEPVHKECSDSGVRTDDEEEEPSEKPEKKENSSAQGLKGAKIPVQMDLQNELIKVLVKNTSMLTSYLEAQNMNYELDRDQRKSHTDSLLAVLGKLTDTVGKIADKL